MVLENLNVDKEHFLELPALQVPGRSLGRTVPALAEGPTGERRRVEQQTHKTGNTESSSRRNTVEAESKYTDTEAAAAKSPSMETPSKDKQQPQSQQRPTAAKRQQGQPRGAPPAGAQLRTPPPASPFPKEEGEIVAPPPAPAAKRPRRPAGKMRKPVGDTFVDKMFKALTVSGELLNVGKFDSLFSHSQGLYSFPPVGHSHISLLLYSFFSNASFFARYPRHKRKF